MLRSLVEAPPGRVGCALVIDPKGEIGPVLERDAAKRLRRIVPSESGVDLMTGPDWRLGADLAHARYLTAAHRIVRRVLSFEPSLPTRVLADHQSPAETTNAELFLHTRRDLAAHRGARLRADGDRRVLAPPEHWCADAEMTGKWMRALLERAHGRAGARGPNALALAAYVSTPRSRSVGRRSTPTRTRTSTIRRHAHAESPTPPFASGSSLGIKSRIMRAIADGSTRPCRSTPQARCAARSTSSRPANPGALREGGETLLDGIDVSTVVGLRDRGFLGVLVYGFARVSAAVSLRVADYYTQGPRSFFRLHEKGGRYNVVPAHHTAQAYVDAYLGGQRVSVVHGLSTRPAGLAPVRRTRPQIHRILPLSWGCEPLDSARCTMRSCRLGLTALDVAKQLVAGRVPEASHA